MMKHFGFSIVFSIVCLALSAYWGYTHGPEAGVQDHAYRTDHYRNFGDYGSVVVV